MARAVTAERAAVRPPPTRRSALPPQSRVLFYLLCAVNHVFN